MKKLLLVGLLVGGGTSLYGMSLKEAKESFYKPEFIEAEKEEQIKHLREVRKQHPELFSEDSNWNTIFIQTLLAKGGSWDYDAEVLEEYLSYAPNTDPGDWTFEFSKIKEKYEKKEVNKRKFAILTAHLGKVNPLSDDDNHEEVDDGSTTESTLHRRLLGGVGLFAVISGLYWYLSTSSDEQAKKA